ncbi:MAG: CHAT domain-containing protein [Ignavibacteriota bacterium]
MKNRAIIFSFLILSVFIGFFFLAVGFLPVEIPSSSHQIRNITQSEPEQSSQRFTRLESTILNSSNLKDLPDSVNQISDNFEKNYLLALIANRKSDYENSFNLLYSLLPSIPKYYPFYDELIFAAKASENMKQIEKFILEHTSQNLYLDFLTALYKYNTNNYPGAIEILRDKKEFEELYLLSYSYRGLGDYETAVQVMKSAESLLNKDDKCFSKVLVSQGSLYLLSGKYDDAEKLYNKSLESAKRFGDSREEIKSLINLAIGDDQYGNVDDAKHKLESALQKSRSIENQELEATALSELAVSYTYSGNVVEAKNNYEESFRIFKILNHKERLSNLCANIATLYSQTGNYSAAIEFYNNGLDYGGENIISKILNIRGLGDVYANLSNYSKSLTYYEKAKELSLKIKDITTGASVDVSIGTLYYNINKPKKALQIFLDANNRIAAESNPYFMEDLNFKIGLAYGLIDSLNKSDYYFNVGLNIAKAINDVYYETLISTEMSHNFYLQKNYIKAENTLIRLLSKSKKVGFNQLFGLQNLYLGKIYSDRKQIPKSISYLNTASTIAEEEKDYNNVLEAEYLLGKNYLYENNSVKAEESFLKAVNLTDKISESLVSNSEIQISHFSGVNNCYHELAELYLKLDRAEDAFLIIEKSHSRNTIQNLTALKINSIYKNKEKLKTFYDYKWMINSNLFSGNKLQNITNEYGNLKKEIYKVSPQLKSSLEENKQLTIKEIQNNLNEKENLITLFFGKSTLYFINITRNKTIVKNIAVTREETIRLLKDIAPLYSTEYQNSDIYLNQDLFSFNTEAANNFYKKVIQPIVRDIPIGKTLIFSMPAELVLLPIEFLVTEFKNDDSPFYYDNKKFLIEDYPVSYTPSASIYVMQKLIKQKNDDKVLLVGDPQISNKDFALSYRGGLLEDDSFNARNIVLYPLKYSKDEINNLNSIFSNGVVLLSENATETQFKENASQSSIIHLSTHSFLLKDQPLIVFSQNKTDKEDGFLETGEILQLRLNSDMVVLSSCRSGLGAVDEAEGVIGMQKSFFEAGAKSIVVSLWDVNDKYTSLFMETFYKYLSEGFDKSESMQKAKIFFKNNYSANPYYWSAFVLSGDVSKINLIKTSYSKHILFILFGIFISIIGFYFYFKKLSS